MEMTITIKITTTNLNFYPNPTFNDVDFGASMLYFHSVA